jgi:heat-inducible transcriptional repressor
VPTDAGYRYYVDALEGPARLPRHEREALARNLHAAGDIDSLLERCCRLLSAASQQVAVGTAASLPQTMFRHVELVRINDDRLIVLLITASGVVYQRVIEAKIEASQADLDRYARFLNEEMEGRTLGQVRDHLAELLATERLAYDGLARRAVELGSRYFAEAVEAEGRLCVDGAERLLERPDLADFDRMKTLVSALDDKRRMLRLLGRCLERSGVSAAIGSENAEPELEGVAIVTASYGDGQSRVGTLGIIGPTRMHYDRAMALVGHVAELLSRAYAASRS